jgi:hypothetical protein
LTQNFGTKFYPFSGDKKWAQIWPNFLGTKLIHFSGIKVWPKTLQNGDERNQHLVAFKVAFWVIVIARLTDFFENAVSIFAPRPQQSRG